MNSPKLGLRVAGTIFGVVSAGHLLRLVSQAEVLIAGHQIPLWVSIAGVLIAGALSVWLWRLSFATTKRQGNQ